MNQSKEANTHLTSFNPLNNWHFSQITDQSNQWSELVVTEKLVNWIAVSAHPKRGHFKQHGACVWVHVMPQLKVLSRVDRWGHSCPGTTYCNFPSHKSIPSAIIPTFGPETCIQMAMETHLRTHTAMLHNSSDQLISPWPLIYPPLIQPSFLPCSISKSVILMGAYDLSLRHSHFISWINLP